MAGGSRGFNAHERPFSRVVATYVNSTPGQNGRHFADDLFRCILVNEMFCILIKVSLKFVSKGLISDNPALV